MENKKIKLNSLMEAKKFVMAAMDCSYDVDVCYNSLVIDAKSILGVLSLDLTKVLTVRMHGKDPVLERYLDTLAPRDARIA